MQMESPLVILPPSPDTYWVGGSVRDWLLGRTPTDLDVATGGDVNQLAEWIAQHHGGRPVTLGRPPFVLVRVMGRHHRFDITPLVGGTIHTDLAHRDFTINAMAIPVSGGEVMDPFGGRSDLDGKRLQPVRDTGMHDDPVRIIRAFRMCGQFEMRLSRATRESIVRHRDRLTIPAPERIRDEMEKLLACARVVDQLEAMAALGVLSIVLPEVAALKGCKQSPPHHADVYTHTMGVVSHLAEHRPRPLHSEFDESVFRWLTLAALFHDAGKPKTCRIGNDDRIRCFGHEKVSAQLADAACRHWRLSNQDRLRVTTMVGMHMRPWHLFAADRQAPVSRRATTRFFDACDSVAGPVLALAEADAAAKEQMPMDEQQEFFAFLRRLADDYQAVYKPAHDTPPLASGKDLLAMGLAPSPALGRLLKELRKAQLSGSVSDRSAALTWLRKHLPR